MKKDRWINYYKIQKPPSPLLIQALEYTINHGIALDLGAGALHDSKFLLDQNFKVIAVDDSLASYELSKTISHSNFKMIQSSFEKFNFETDIYDLINAQWSLLFNPQKSFHDVFRKLKQSLKINGIFTGQLFGIYDEWNTQDPAMTFLDAKTIQDLFQDFELLEYREEEYDKPTASNVMKHWHIFYIIGRKIKE